MSFLLPILFLPAMGQFSLPPFFIYCHKTLKKPLTTFVTSESKQWFSDHARNMIGHLVIVISQDLEILAIRSVIQGSSPAEIHRKLRPVLFSKQELFFHCTSGEGASKGMLAMPSHRYCLCMCKLMKFVSKFELEMIQNTD